MASDEILDLPPYIYIDPEYQQELRQMLRHALAASRVGVPAPGDTKQLEQQMQPRTAQEFDALERDLAQALGEVRRLRKASGMGGWWRRLSAKLTGR